MDILKERAIEVLDWYYDTIEGCSNIDKFIVELSKVAESMADILTDFVYDE